MKYLLDTDICIALFRGKDNVVKKIAKIGLKECAISEITRTEILVGREIAKLKQLKVKDFFFDSFFNSITIYPFSDIPMSNSVKRYAENKAKLIVTGKRIEDFDLIIASTAQAHGLTLVTGNISHMSRIDGLEIEDWTER